MKEYDLDDPVNTDIIVMAQSGYGYADIIAKHSIGSGRIAAVLKQAGVSPGQGRKSAPPAHVPRSQPLPILRCKTYPPKPVYKKIRPPNGIGFITMIDEEATRLQNQPDYLQPCVKEDVYDLNSPEWPGYRWNGKLVEYDPTYWRVKDQVATGENVEDEPEMTFPDANGDIDPSAPRFIDKVVYNQGHPVNIVPSRVDDCVWLMKRISSKGE